MQTHQAKFLKLVNEQKFIPSLKTYNDTLLFYYLGNLAMSNGPGNLIEIGVGGSTLPLVELSEQFQRQFTLIDHSKTTVTNILTSEVSSYYPQAKIDCHYIDSLLLPSTINDNFGYCHIDGSKKYTVTLGDLEFCTAKLCNNGLICQDDYGNNKWPTVTDAVHVMLNRGELKMVVVGDSSAWLTRPEYYDYWMSLLNNDEEFNALIPFLNIVNSAEQEKVPNYFFMQSLLANKPDNITEEMFDYYDQLLSLNVPGYLQMPYADQSATGLHLRRVDRAYTLTLKWNQLRGSSWPVLPPTTREDIDQLPEFVYNELINLHQITDLYHEVHNALLDKCIRKDTI